MAFVLGVDGGGTKTHVVVADTNGKVLGGSMVGPTNWEEVGLLPAGRTLREGIEGALSSAGAKPGDVAASVYGLAGVDWPSDVPRIGSILHPIGLGGHREIVNDSFVALRAGASRPWGVVVIAGSGTVTSGRNERGEVFRTLGLGPAFGEFGGAGDIAAEAVRALGQAYLGSGPPTVLTESLCEAAQCGSAAEFIERFSRRQLSARGLAGDDLDSGKLAPLVVAAAERGDGPAQDVVRRAGTSLGESAAHVARRLSMERSEFEVVLAGGFLRSKTPILMSSLEESLKRTAPRAKLVSLEAPPVVGAALLAMELATGDSHELVHSFLSMAVGRLLQAA